MREIGESLSQPYFSVGWCVPRKNWNTAMMLKEMRETQFPKDLEAAFELGAKLGSGK